MVCDNLSIDQKMFYSAIQFDHEISSSYVDGLSLNITLFRPESIKEHFKDLAFFVGKAPTGYFVNDIEGVNTLMNVYYFLDDGSDVVINYLKRKC